MKKSRPLLIINNCNTSLLLLTWFVLHPLSVHCKSMFSILDPLPFSNSSMSSVSVQLFNPLCKLQLTSRCAIQPVQYYNFSLVDQSRSVYQSSVMDPCYASSSYAWNIQVFCSGIPNQFQTVRWLPSAPQCKSLHWSVSRQTCKQVQLDITTPFDAWFISPQNPATPYVITKNTIFSDTVSREYNTSLVWTLMPMVRECEPQSMVVEYDPIFVEKCKPKPNIDFSMAFSLTIDSFSDNTVISLTWFLLVMGYCCGLLFGVWQRSSVRHQFVVTYIWNLCAMPILNTTGFSLFATIQLAASVAAFFVFLGYHISLFMKYSKTFVSLPTHINHTNISCYLCVLCNNIFVMIVATITQ